MCKLILVIATLLAASFLSACGPTANTNTTNKPVTSATSSMPAATPNPAATETDIKKLVTDTAAALAKNDAAALEKLYADNYMLVNLDGSVQNKAERIGSIKSGDTKFDSFAYDEVTVRTNPEGTGAVVIARATASGINKGKKTDGTIRVTQVWSKTKDGWQQVSGHATQITSTAASPASNTPASNSNASSASNSNNNTNAGR